MKHIVGLKCMLCGREYSHKEVDYVCPRHANEGILDVRYAYEVIKKRISRATLAGNKDTTIWRYKALLPVDFQAATPPLAVGGTPIYMAEKIAAEIGLKMVWIKDDGRQPTASFKDRASALALVKAREKGVSVITTASTGNAAAALSGLCASMGQANVIFVPESAPQAKIAQLLVFGSTVMLVKGTYDDAFDLCLAAADRFGWYNRNTGFNPYMCEGKKTAAFEICEQLDWQVPDYLFVSVGDGCIIGGLHKGFKDLLALGWIDCMPRLMGVQAQGSDYLYQAWANDEDVLTKPAIVADTVADSIAAGLPRDRLKALAAVKESRGAFIRVSDDEILAAVPDLARKSGVFAEPAGAAAYAGLIKAAHGGRIGPQDTALVLNTGSGLKDIQAAMRAVENTDTRAHLIPPDLTAVEEIMSR
jgi:threonine synthase